MTTQAELAEELRQLRDQAEKVEHEVESLQTFRVAFDLSWSVIPILTQH